VRHGEAGLPLREAIGPPRLVGWRLVALVLGGLLIATAWWQVLGVSADLDVAVTTRDGVPVTLFVPEGAADAPGVVVAHGFAGSAQLMRTFALALAGAGQVVAVPDLPGHGSNPAPLATDDEGAGLLAAVRTAMELLQERPEVAADAVVVLGHSMGSRPAMQVGIAQPDEVAGVVAVSPTDAPVTAAAPPNLLLLAGELEPRFVGNAEDLLARAGGASSDVRADLATGRARALRVVPGVEHLSILFSPTAHRESVRWVQLASGRPGPAAATPPLLLWWALHLAGVLLVWRALAPVLATPQDEPGRRGRPLLAAAAGGVAATLALAVVGAAVDLGGVGPVLVAPALALWFGVAGVVWLAVGPRPGAPDARDAAWSVALLAVLVAAFGLLAAEVWLPWFPIPARAVLALPLGLAVLPWTLAFAAAAQHRRGIRLVGWWLAASVILLVTLGLAASVVGGLGFVILVLPLLPAVLALAVVVWAPLQRPWAAGVATAAFLGWTMAVMFPLV
jgi:alpha-beta hydrolase superfamily lysophospholipase